MFRQLASSESEIKCVALAEVQRWGVKLGVSQKGATTLREKGKM